MSPTNLKWVPSRSRKTHSVGSSGGRRAKENAIVSKAEDRIIKDLEKLSKRVDKGRIKDRPTLDQAVGRLKERHFRVARFYKIEALAKPHHSGRTSGRMPLLRTLRKLTL